MPAQPAPARSSASFHPLPVGPVIAARALVAALSVLAITAVLLAIGWAAFAAHIPGRTGPAFVLDIIVGAVVFSCLGFAVASLISNIDAAQPVTLAIVPSALLPLRCFHLNPGTAALADRRRQGLPGTRARGRPPRRV